MKTSVIAAKFLTALVLSSFPVSAASLSVTGIDWNLGQMVDLSTSGQSKVTFAGIIFAEYANSPVSLFCVDLFTDVGIETFSVNAGSVDLVLNGRRASWLMQTYLPLIANADQAAAVQVAIWDVVHDGGDGLTNGALQGGATPTSVVQLAEQYIAASSGQGTTAGGIFTHVDGPTARQQLMAPGNFTAAAFGFVVPEPATYLAMGSGLLILGLARRKRNSN
ncbi:MAG: PEP-CTERM sorting domain-containing protein [Acidobacteria bacterium]|nr:PEP-CTERM sorting domain-containing protein [Acidobacteriota bacterium]